MAAFERADAGNLGEAEVAKLRGAHYNAQVTEFRLVHDDLAILRVRPDWGRLEFIPGQYTVLALGYWEPRVAGVQAEALEPGQFKQLAKRAYSIGASMLDSSGRIAPPQHGDELEFYVALVRQAEKHAPALTPRLFALSAGDRLYLGPHAHGHYTLEGVRPEDDLVFAATGTGEAPHNAMLAELLARGHRGRIVSITCVRYERDLAYLATHRRLEQMFSDYHYVALTTREPCNVDPTRPDYVGKCYLQDYFASGRLEESCALTLDPARTHVFLCGNPTMIGAPQHAHALRFYPRPTGMVEILEARGFRLDEPHHAGNIHLEKYW
jgi:ferredoxin--NADP+ reductase